MSGFLHRLAERAAGRATPIHSATTFPYVSPVTSWDEPLSLPPHEHVAIPRQSESVTVRPMRTQDEYMDLAEPVPPDQSDCATAEVADTKEGLRHEESVMAEQISQGTHVRGFREKARVPMGMRPSGLSAATAPKPEPLLPLDPSAPTIRAAGGSISPTTRRQDRAGAAIEETTEVHVRIGRIEVSAVHEAPAPRRPPEPQANKPMSLDDYLARRQGGGT